MGGNLVKPGSAPGADVVGAILDDVGFEGMCGHLAAGKVVAANQTIVLSSSFFDFPVNSPNPLSPARGDRRGP